MSSWQLYVWVVSVLLAATAGYGTAWAIGFRRGVRWARSHPARRGGWPRMARDRRKREDGPPPVTGERRTDRQPPGRHAGPPTSEIPAQERQQPPVP